MKIVEAEAKNNQQSKGKKIEVKRTVEVWRWPLANNRDAATAMVMATAM
jgi:hypothetical protein